MLDSGPKVKAQSPDQYVFRSPRVWQMQRFDDNFKSFAQELIGYYSFAMRIGIPGLFIHPQGTGGQDCPNDLWKFAKQTLHLA